MTEKFIKCVCTSLLLAGACAVTASALTPPANSPLKRKAPVDRFRHNTVAASVRGVHPTVAPLHAGRIAMASNAPQRITSGGTALYGYRTAGHSQYDDGWYRFDANGFTMQWSDPLFTYDNGYGQLNSAWVRNGRLCGFDHWFQYGYFWGQEYYEIDLSSGMIVTDETDEDCIDNGWFINACYDPESDTIYGYGTDDENESSTALFMKTSGSNVFGYQIIANYGKNAADYRKQCLAMCYNPTDKQIYGINMNGEFVTVDKSTGNQTVLFNIDRPLGMYVTGLAYSQIEGLFYWNYQYDKTDGNWGSDLCTINAQTHEIKTLESYEGGDAFSALFVIGQNVDASAPKRPELKSADFANGATAGSLTYTLPTEAVSGATLSGSLDWALKVDGRAKSNGQAAPGSDVTIPLELTAGRHTFAFSVSANGAQSPELSTEMYIGSDNPKAPATVVLDDKNIRWSPVTEGVNGGYIDPEQVKYEVYLNGELLTTTARTLYQYTLPEDAPVQKWIAWVAAVYDGKKSMATYSEPLVAGAPWQLPVSIVCTEEMLELMKVVNVNGDDETWTYSDWDKGWYSGQVDEGTGDDWVFLPAIYFPDASHNYSFYMDAMRKANVYPDTWLEVKIGEYPSPEMMNRTILPLFTAQSRDYKEFSNPIFTVPEAGTYYIGIHCKSNVDMCGSIIGGIRVRDDNMQPNSPAAVENLTATPGANGALEADLTFTMPTKFVNGDAIPAASTVSATVTGAQSVTVTGAPGAEVTAKVATVQGDNEITVRTSVDNVTGMVSVVKVYTGVSVPSYVKNLNGTVSADMMSIDMTWETPDAETRGGYVDPATTTYYFALYDPETRDYTFTLAGTGINSATYHLPDGMPQDLYTVGLVAENVAGRSSRLMRMDAILGPAHQLPLSEDFESLGFTFNPWVNYTNDGSAVTWTMLPLQDIATEWAGLTSVALVGYLRSENTEGEGTLGMPRFSPKGNNVVTVKVKYWAGDQAARLSFKGASYGTEATTLHECPLSNTDEWRTAEFQLPASLMSSDWVQLYLNSLFGTGMNYCIVEDIKVEGDKAGLIAVADGLGSIVPGEGYIEFKGYAGETAEIYTAGGGLAGRSTLSGDATRLSVSAGIYLVKVAGKSVKLLVK